MSKPMREAHVCGETQRMFQATLGRAKRLLPERLKRKIKVALGVPDMEASLLNLKRCGFSPKNVIDVGAYTGEWSQMCRRLFSDARILMIEPQSGSRETLWEMVALDGHLQFSPALVGACVQPSVAFYLAESGSSTLPNAEPSAVNIVSLPMTTLDEVTRSTEFSKPEFIKLDVQGAELSVLQGGATTLQSAEVILMEVNLLELYSGAPLFDETIAFMANRGFKVYDICTFFRRPLDNALWQTDVIFVKSSSPLVGSKCWGPLQP